MNNQEEVKTGESPYTPPKPSARASIHNHDHCIFANRENMGRYGIQVRCEDTSHKAGTSPQQQDMGVDEIDNAMSKFARQSSPVTMIQTQRDKNTRGRRNSLSISDQQFSDDSDSESELLAKSLPANLPSYYCSEDLAHLSLPTDFYKTINDKSTTESMNGGRMYLYNDHTHSKQAEQILKYRSKETKSRIPLFLPILGIVSVVAAVFFNDIHNFVYESNRTYYDESKFTEDLNALGEKYRINDHSILEVQTGISTIIERNDTGSFVFLYDSGIVNFNDLQFRTFMKDIASMAARFLRNDTTSIQPTIIQSSELNMETHSELMTKYKNDVAKTGVMLIQDVDRVPSSLAMAFHYFCDEYNPLVTKSAIFFTLNLAKCPNNSDIKATHDDIEKCLANKWSRVPKDNIKPLLARVVNVVVDVTGVS